MTWYVHRRDDGSIASAHSRQRPGYADEALADDDPELVAFHEAPREAARQRDTARNAALGALSVRGNGAVTREEIEALKAAVRALLA